MRSGIAAAVEGDNNGSTIAVEGGSVEDSVGSVEEVGEVGEVAYVDGLACRVLHCDASTVTPPLCDQAPPREGREGRGGGEGGSEDVGVGGNRGAPVPELPERGVARRGVAKRGPASPTSPGMEVYI